jgi:class 3 adenylate cyclase
MGVWSRWTLDFEDAELEARYRARADEAVRPRATAAAALGVVAFVAFGVLDRHVIADPDRVLVPRVATTVFVALVFLVLRRGIFPQATMGLILVAGVVGAWSLDVGALIAPLPMSYVAGGHMLTAIALFALVAPRIRVAYPAALLIVVGFGVTSAFAFEGAAWHERVTNAVFVTLAVVFGGIAAYMIERARRREFVSELELAEERARSDRLLLNILPEDIVNRLRVDPRTIAEASEEVSVVFADVVDFTPLAAELKPRELVDLLDRLFSEFDAVCRLHGVEKIKTIGDAYMAVAGVPRPDPDHAASAAKVALGWLEVARGFDRWPGKLELRVGISSGPSSRGSSAATSSPTTCGATR